MHAGLHESQVVVELRSSSVQVFRNHRPSETDDVVLLHKSLANPSSWHAWSPRSVTHHTTHHLSQIMVLTVWFDCNIIQQIKQQTGTMCCDEWSHVKDTVLCRINKVQNWQIQVAGKLSKVREIIHYMIMLQGTRINSMPPCAWLTSGMKSQHRVLDKLRHPHVLLCVWKLSNQTNVPRSW